jgi:hypothetical protein
LGNHINSRRLKASTKRAAVQGQFELAHIAYRYRIASVDSPRRCGCITIAAVALAIRSRAPLLAASAPRLAKQPRNLEVR